MSFCRKAILLSQVVFFFASAQTQSEFGTFDAQIGFFSSGGFGRYDQSDLRGGYTNLFGTFEIKSKEFFGFEFGVGVSATGLLHKVKNKDIYSDIVNDIVGIGFRINNDEAKDFRYTSTGFLFHTLYARYKNDWGSLNMGRFPLSLEWIGDYVEGVSAVIDRFEDWTIQAGWFDAQAYANAQENISFGYINYWYNHYEGYQIKNNYFLDVKYHHHLLDLNLYYNYFDTLLYMVGIRTDWNLAYGEWEFKTRLHYVFVNASKQSTQYCNNPSLNELAGLACYVPESMGSVAGYLWQVEQAFKYKGLHFALGYLQNDKRNATNNLPIYADDNPLEYNTVVYGEGAKTGYATIRYDYKGRYFLGLKYGISYYGNVEDKSSQGQFNALCGIVLKQMDISLGYINIDDANGYKNNIAKVWLGFKF
ncbi:hypothetical protein BKH41_07355 [Helicobacter sp. 12S02232-10]|uniref:Opr family porin n=1 Tax=Helicobacter sp. 12S02232-10 TaxID=1476197 RepID=UPI000BA58C3A|nr:Opr family porin [Helicobacter sp. 12S02232-10]PAF47697.1 hypothetical protein BKH41_07355 [Helicobacter sp. 12S02232-10]